MENYVNSKLIPVSIRHCSPVYLIMLSFNISRWYPAQSSSLKTFNISYEFLMKWLQMGNTSCCFEHHKEIATLQWTQKAYIVILLETIHHIITKSHCSKLAFWSIVELRPCQIESTPLSPIYLALPSLQAIIGNSMIAYRAERYCYSLIHIRKY